MQHTKAYSIVLCNFVESNEVMDGLYGLGLSNSILSVLRELIKGMYTQERMANPCLNSARAT